MSRFQERLTDYSNAVDRLKDALQEKESEIVIDGGLHRFEFTFELAWKTIKDCLEYLGITERTGTPRENIKLGFQHGLIQDGEKWIEIMLSKNSLSHLYDEKASREIYQKIKKEYLEEFINLRERLKEI